MFEALPAKSHAVINIYMQAVLEGMSYVLSDLDLIFHFDLIQKPELSFPLTPMQWRTDDLFFSSSFFPLLQK